AGGSEATLDGDDGAPGTAEMAVRGGGGGGGGGVGKVLLRARVVGGLTNSSSIVTPTPTVL
ncbi:MAG: hypothetical protein IPI49_13730, partial [Myxococcales bacterium]|nr:hypothetical protein [Myxococcales bacterium]